MFRARVQVGEVAAPATRDKDLLPRLIVSLEYEHPATAPAGLHRAHQPGSTGAQDDHVVHGLRLPRHAGVPRRTRPATLRRAHRGATTCRPGGARRRTAAFAAPGRAVLGADDAPRLYSQVLFAKDDVENHMEYFEDEYVEVAEGYCEEGKVIV